MHRVVPAETFARLVGLTLLTVTGCTAPVAFRDAELAALRRFHQGIVASQAEPVAALFTDRLLWTLPEGTDLEHADLRGGVAHAQRGTQPLLLRGADLTAHPYRDAVARIVSQEHLELAMAWNAADLGFVLCAGQALTGFDQIHDLAFRSNARGLVLAGVRRGVPCVVTGEQVATNEKLEPRFGPVLSADGSTLAFARSGVLGTRTLLAPAEDLAQSRPLELPAGTIQWPPMLDHTGAHWLAIVRRGRSKLLVHDGTPRGPFDDASYVQADQPGLLTALIADRDQQFYWVDGRELPAFASVRWLRTADRGKVTAFVGRDDPAGQDHLVVQRRTALSHPQIINLALSATGERWVCTVRDRDGDRILTPDQSFGPFPAVTALRISDDGQSVGFDAEFDGRQQRSFVNGEPLGLDYQTLDKIYLLGGGAGAVFAGWQDGWWVVTPAGRDGPWDWVGPGVVAPDGAKVAFVARRGREVWRRAMAATPRDS